MVFFQFYLYSNKEVRKVMNNNKDTTKMINNKIKFIVIINYIVIFLFSFVYIVYKNENYALYGLKILTIVFTLDLLIQYFIMFKNYNFKMKFMIIFMVLASLALSGLIVLYYSLYGFDVFALFCYLTNIIAISIVWINFFIRWKRNQIQGE